MMRKLAVVVGLGLMWGVVGCDQAEELPGVGPDGEPLEALEPFNETPEQKTMRLAIEQARKTAPELIDAIQNPTEQPRVIEVKAMVRDDIAGVSEVLRLRQLTYADGKIHGKIDDNPLILENIKPGQAASVAPDQIIDWYIIEGTSIRGAYTLRVMRERMDPEERRAFDDEMGVKFD